jgi:membrane AbrB-like protein
MGGWAFALVGMPLPWMLGSLTATGVLATIGDRWMVPSPVRTLTRPVIGVLAGSAFTPAVVEMLPSWWPVFLLVFCYTLLVSVVGFLFFSRVCRFDPVTAYFSAAPGGIGEMLILGGLYGGKSRTIVLVHVVRILAMVCTIPVAIQLFYGGPNPQAALSDRPPLSLEDWFGLLAIGGAGYAVGRYTGFPGGSMTASMLISAAAHGSGLVSAIPSGTIVVAAQALIGAVAGARLAGLTRGELRALAVPALAWAGILLATAALAAAAAAPAVGTEFLTLLVGLASGGTAEMIMMAIALGSDVALVSACQVIRILLVFVGAPFLFAAVSRRNRWR